AEQFREAVLGRDGQAAEGQVHDGAGADAIRLARDRGRRHPRSQGAAVRGGQAAARSADAGTAARSLFQGPAKQGRNLEHVSSGRGAGRRCAGCRVRGQAATPALFSRAGSPSVTGNCSGSMLFLRGAGHASRARLAPELIVFHARTEPKRIEESMAFIRHPKDVFAGLLFIAFGIAAIVIGSGYALGTAARMGPGYFPRILGLLLIVLGLALALRALRISGPPIPVFKWRPLLVVLG